MNRKESTTDLIPTEQQILDVYEPPALQELGTLEDLTWETSTDTFVISTW